VRRSFLRTPSPSMAVAMTALFVSLGGTGYAATQLGHSPAAAVAKKKKKPPAHPDSSADKKLFNSLFSALIPGAHVAFAASAGSASTAGSAATAASATHATTADSATSATSATSAGHATTADVANALPALAWQNLTLENGWIPYPGPYASTPRLSKDLSGFVHLSGTLDGAGQTSNMFATLPAGFRPTTPHAWVIVASTNGSYNPHLVNLDIESNGAIKVYNGEGANDNFVSLEGVSFYAG
jgi:hypothetical protein